MNRFDGPNTKHNEIKSVFFTPKNRLLASGVDFGGASSGIDKTTIHTPLHEVVKKGFNPSQLYQSMSQQEGQQTAVQQPQQDPRKPQSTTDQQQKRDAQQRHSQQEKPKAQPSAQPDEQGKAPKA